MPMRPVFSRAVFNKKRALPRMSWAPENLYNLWQRTSAEGSLKQETSFVRTSMTLFQQRWRSKRLIRGYHGDHIGQKKFERWYLPEQLPSIHSPAPATGIAKWVDGRSKQGGRNEEEKRREKSEREGRSPVGTMMFREVERRIDVLIFRACFAPSVWAARQLVVHGKVKVNGQKVSNPNSRLQPGDLFTIDPKAMTLLQPLQASSSKLIESSEASEESETSEASETAEATVPEADEAEIESTQKPSTHFTLPAYAQPHLFIPAYLLPSFLTCSAVYVRHPTARPGYSEIPSPYDADGEVMSLGWEFHKRVAPRMRGRRERWMDPERSRDRK